MKASDLLIEIRKIVREELSMAGVQPATNVNSVVETTTPAKTQRPIAARPKKPIVSNPILNEILSSTSPMQGDYSDWPTMSYGSDRVAPKMEVAGLSIETLEQHVPEVAAAVTRDYSALMKAIDKRKGK